MEGTWVRKIGVFFYKIFCLRRFFEAVPLRASLSGEILVDGFPPAYKLGEFSSFLENSCTNCWRDQFFSVGHVTK